MRSSGPASPVKTFYTRILCLIIPAFLFPNIAGFAQNKPVPRRGPAGKPGNLSLYERIEKNFTRHPELARQLESPPEEMKEVMWMVGDWETEAHVFKTRTTPERTSRGTSEIRPRMGSRWLYIHDTYPDGGEDEGYLTFNPVTKHWISVALDTTGNAVVTTARRWEGNRLVFLAKNIRVVGERVTLRQTMEKKSDTEYHILNEERLPNGKWIALDEYTYRKKTTSN